MGGKSRAVSEAEWHAAILAGDEARSSERYAVKAWYEPGEGLIVVALDNGARFSFPPDLGQGLGGATSEELAEVEVVSGGTGLHWEALDADLGVDALVRGIFGSPEWTASREAAIGELAKRAGQISTPKKAAAARETIPRWATEPPAKS